MNYKIHAVFLTHMLIGICMCDGTCVKQDVNFFFVDGRRNGPLLTKGKGDLRELLVQNLHQCSKLLARGHPGKFQRQLKELYVFYFFHFLL